MRAGLLTLLAAGLAFGLVTVGQQGLASVTYLLFAPPFTAWLVAATLSARDAVADEQRQAATPRLRVALAGAAGVAVVILAVTAATVTGSAINTGSVGGGGSAAATPAPTPSERHRFLEFLDHVLDEREAQLVVTADVASVASDQSDVGDRRAGVARRARARCVLRVGVARLA